MQSHLGKARAFNDAQAAVSRGLGISIRLRGSACEQPVLLGPVERQIEFGQTRRRELGMCDRSVVRSSVMPSAKYCWSGSLLRLAKGSTTIDRRGATRGRPMEVVAAVATADAGLEAVRAVGQTHQAMAAMTSRATADPAT